MGFRIIDRKKNDKRHLNKNKKDALIQDLAERFGAFKGGDHEQNKTEFVNKIEKIAKILKDEDSYEVAKKLEKNIIKKDKESILIQGNLEPSIILDLL